MGVASLLKSMLAVDPPISLAANYSFDDLDRRYIDNQILACETHLVTSLIRGTISTWVIVDGASPALATGDVVCLAGSTTGVPTVTKALATPLASAGAALGVVLQAAASGSFALIGIEGIVNPTVTNLAAASPGLARVNPSTGRLQFVASYSPGDYPLGTVDNGGYLTLTRPSGVVTNTSIGQVSYQLDASSASVTKGQCVCIKPGTGNVTLANAAALALCGAVLGIAMSNVAPGATFMVAIESFVPNSVTGLGAGAVSPVRCNTTTSLLERVASFGTSDYPVGYAAGNGDVTEVRGIVVGVGPTGTASGVLGGTYPSPTMSLTGNASLTGLLPTSKIANPNVRAVTTTYTVDSISHDDILEVSTGGGPFTITLPDPAVHQLPIDIYGDFGTNNLTIARHGSETIGGLAASYVCQANKGHYRLTPDGTNWLLSGTPRKISQQFTGSGTFTPKANVTVVDLMGTGGGGSGGGGGRPPTASKTTARSMGGGGGGGAITSVVKDVPVTPGTGVTVTIGTGGAAAAGGNADNTAGTAGNAGADTTFGTLHTFPGAGGGEAGQVNSTTAGLWSNGGASNRTVPVRSPSQLTGAVDVLVSGPGQGGWAGNLTPAGSGTAAATATGSATPSTGGSQGTDATNVAGYGGGGGGSSAFGVGGNGGNGGNGSAGVATVGGAGGTPAGTAYGAGSGGGGGGGQGGGGSAAGGASGTAIPGQLTVEWSEP